MQLALITSILAFCASQVAADGAITVCRGANGASCSTIGGLARPDNCSGGCLSAPGTKSVKAANVDPGNYCFTAYSDRNCNSGALKVEGHFQNGNFEAYSYDCC
ncbi:uncharacterized protein EKO05_0002930 [Ascochyta rabiei]|uniref:Uncharacterized protein n=1 Tax=Didymella rabiei TaxID=5454 RepID=A0A162X1S6_DIDRA|nr:uncharacterized protein EKO05_0002930 [Ascochyta rabiei]KZM19311.1 hypothetical protein ST47_g9524 [Ascochyta rabiei]UPX12380.1 hypothetical protein EKO05_0002930 [Ascochyta rabiei]